MPRTTSRREFQEMLRRAEEESRKTLEKETELRRMAGLTVTPQEKAELGLDELDNTGGPAGPEEDLSALGIDPALLEEDRKAREALARSGQVRHASTLSCGARCRRTQVAHESGWKAVENGRDSSLFMRIP